jgi:hypothetical protein
MRWCLLLVMAVAACSNLPGQVPLGPVEPAPRALADLRIHVKNATRHHADEAGETSYTGYTMQVRGAVQRALAAAGYVVVVDPAAPRDLLAMVHTDYQSGGKVVGGDLVTAITLTSGGREVEQLSGTVRVGDSSDILTPDAAALVEAIARSRRVQRFAAEVSRPDVACRQPDAVMADGSAP